MGQAGRWGGHGAVDLLGGRQGPHQSASGQLRFDERPEQEGPACRSGVVAQSRAGHVGGCCRTTAVGQGDGEVGRCHLPVDGPGQPVEERGQQRGVGVAVGPEVGRHHDGGQAGTVRVAGNGPPVEQVAPPLGGAAKGSSVLSPTRVTGHEAHHTPASSHPRGAVGQSLGFGDRGLGLHGLPERPGQGVGDCGGRPRSSLRGGVVGDGPSGGKGRGGVAILRPGHRDQRGDGGAVGLFDERRLGEGPAVRHRLALEGVVGRLHQQAHPVVPLGGLGSQLQERGPATRGEGGRSLSGEGPGRCRVACLQQVVGAGAVAVGQVGQAAVHRPTGVIRQPAERRLPHQLVAEPQEAGIGRHQIGGQQGVGRATNRRDRHSLGSPREQGQSGLALVVELVDAPGERLGQAGRHAAHHRELLGHQGVAPGGGDDLRHSLLPEVRSPVEHQGPHLVVDERGEAHERPARPCHSRPGGRCPFVSGADPRQEGDDAGQL